MDKDLSEKLKSNESERETTLDELNKRREHLDAVLYFHGELQEQTANGIVSPQALQELDRNTEKSLEADQDCCDRRTRLDKDEPDFIAKNIKIMEETTGTRIQCSRESDVVIQREANRPINTLEESGQHRDDLYSWYKSCAEEARSLVMEGVELNKLIQQGDNKESDSQGSTNTAKDSGSLVEDFANPNLEQPSYMDPDD